MIGAVVAGVNFATNFMKGIQTGKKYKKMAKQYQEMARQYRLNARRVRYEGSLNEDFMRAGERGALAQLGASVGEVGMAESPTSAVVEKSVAHNMEQAVLNERYRTESEAEYYLYQARVAEENARKMKKKKKHAFSNALVSGTVAAVGSLY